MTCVIGHNTPWPANTEPSCPLTQSIPLANVHPFRSGYVLFFFHTFSLTKHLFFIAMLTITNSAMSSSTNIEVGGTRIGKCRQTSIVGVRVCSFWSFIPFYYLFINFFSYDDKQCHIIQHQHWSGQHKDRASAAKWASLGYRYDHFDLLYPFTNYLFISQLRQRTVPHHRAPTSKWAAQG
jgi:hypothetical protein